ncbi:hypothetical protein [Burkholderia sp. Ac-20344]|uniref:hypothetical protein n=1 Tax=Burkholderia sp. Ac-20344 TaxID=2703890 RepID=UPI001F12261C|nr:hypothetical protein [Burkholderia sp. Ac-20344]
MALAVDPLAILDLQFAWLGNLLLVVALIKPNRIVSTLLAVAFAPGWHTIPTGPDFKPIHAFGIGYDLWIAAMAGGAALPWIGGCGVLLLIRNAKEMNQTAIHAACPACGCVSLPSPYSRSTFEITTR